MHQQCLRERRPSLGVIGGATLALSAGVAIAESDRTPRSDPREPVSIAELVPAFSSTGDFRSLLNANNDTPNIASDPTLEGAADVAAFASIDCIPDLLNTVIPIGSHSSLDNFEAPWKIAEGFLADVGLNPQLPPATPMQVSSARVTLFGPSGTLDDPVTPEFESDLLQNPTFLTNTRWTFRYYRESGDAQNLNTPHLPPIDPLQAVGGDNAQDLIAKFQWVGTGWFEETCIGFDSDAVPVTGIDVGVSPTCLNFTGLGPTCIGAVAIEHDPVTVFDDTCYWLECVPEIAPSVEVASFWAVSGSNSTTVPQDGLSWHDTSNPSTGFINGTQRDVDIAMCVNIDSTSGDDIGQNLSDYVSAGCTSVTCNEPFGVQDTCDEALPITLSSSVTGDTFCSAQNGFDSLPAPAPTPTGDTANTLAFAQPLWYSITGNGNDFAIDLCFPGTDDSLGVSRNWWIALYCTAQGGVCSNLGDAFAVASAASTDNLNSACVLQFDPDGDADFPRLEFPTTSGQTYLFAIFSELAEGSIEFQVEDLGTLSSTPASQCADCDFSIDPGLPTMPADIVEGEDEQSPNSPTDGQCTDLFGFVDGFDWVIETRANDFCNFTGDLANNFPAQFDAYLPAFTPLNGAPQSDIFLPNFGGPGQLGSADSSYDLTQALQPVSIPFATTLQGLFLDEPFGGNSGGPADQDHFGFTVSEPCIVRFTATAESGFNNTISTALGKIDPLSGERDPMLGFDCGTRRAVSDGGGALACGTSLNSTVCVPGEFYYLSMTTDRTNQIDCQSPTGRRWFAEVEMFACPQVTPSPVTQDQSDECRADFPEFDAMGEPVFVDDPNNPGNPLQLLFPNGDLRFVDLIDQFNQPIPGGFNLAQQDDPMTQEPRVDANGEPLLAPASTGEFLQTAFFQRRDANGNLLFDQMTGFPLLEERPYFERTPFQQAIVRDTNRGCNADPNNGEMVAFDLVVADGTPIAGTIGEDPFSPTRRADIDWYEFVAPSTSVDINARFFADLYLELFEAPALIPQDLPPFSECPGVVIPPFVAAGCEPLTLVAAWVFVATPDGLGEGCTHPGITVTGLVPGETYVFRLQLGEPLQPANAPGLLGAVSFSPIAMDDTPVTFPNGNSGSGLSCEGGLDSYEVEIDPSATDCDADLTTTGATLSGQPGFGIPDGTVDLDDLGYFLTFFLLSDASVADLTTSGATLEGQPGFGVPDGTVDLDDLGYFLNLWLVGCP